MPWAGCQLAELCSSTGFCWGKHQLLPFLCLLGPAAPVQGAAGALSLLPVVPVLQNWAVAGKHSSAHSSDVPQELHLRALGQLPWEFHPTTGWGGESTSSGAPEL